MGGAQPCVHACARVPKPGWQWDSQSHRLPPPAASPACAPGLGQGLQAGRDTHPACQASSSDVSQELGTESRQVNPQPPPCLGITGSAVPGVGGGTRGWRRKPRGRGTVIPSTSSQLRCQPPHPTLGLRWGGRPQHCPLGAPRCWALALDHAIRCSMALGVQRPPCQGWGSELGPEERAGRSVPRTLAHAHHEAQPTAKPGRSFPTADPPPRYKPEPGWGSWGRAPRQT